MKRLWSPEHSLEAVAAMLALVAALGVLQSFIIGRHFVIPTMILFVAVLFGNLARFGLQGQRWAKHMLFWIFALMSCHAFFALFWAAEARPGAFFGAAFYPLYGGVFVGLAVLCWHYAGRNDLF
jgi:uncharacterized membrane-anchored protein YitT (DUF2179 family)